MTNTIKLEPGTTETDANRILRQVGAFSEWVKGKCLFKCSLCLHQKVFRDLVEFKLHLQSSHFTSYKNYLATFSDPCILEKRTTCLICQKVRHRLKSISPKMRSFFIPAYFQRFQAIVVHPIRSLISESGQMARLGLLFLPPYAATGNWTHGSRVASSWGTFKGHSADWATRPQQTLSLSYLNEL